MGFPAGRKSASPFCAIRPSHNLAILTSDGASSESTLSGLASFFSVSSHLHVDSQDGFRRVVWREFGLFYENHILHRVWKTITSVGFSGRSSSLVVSPSFGISVGKRTDRRYLLINRRVLAVRQHSVLNSIYHAVRFLRDLAVVSALPAILTTRPLRGRNGEVAAE